MCVVYNRASRWRIKMSTWSVFINHVQVQSIKKSIKNKVKKIAIKILFNVCLCLVWLALTCGYHWRVVYLAQITKLWNCIELRTRYCNFLYQLLIVFLLININIIAGTCHKSNMNIPHFGHAQTKLNLHSVHLSLS